MEGHAPKAEGTPACLGVATQPYSCLQVEAATQRVVDDHAAAESDGRARVLLQGHASTVYALVAAKTRPLVFSGSYDRTIKVWDALTCECIHTLVGHKWAVFSLALWEERVDEGGRMRLFSGSGDHNIRVWDVAGETYECKKTLEGHKYDIRALTVSEDRLYSGCYDMTIKIWDVDTLECLRTITGLVGPPFSLRAYTPLNRLYSAGWNKPIDVFDLSTLKRVDGLSGIDGHQSLVYCLEVASGDLIYSGSIDTTIKVWSLVDNSFVKTITGHTLGVNGLAIIGQYLYSGSDDQTIRAWRLVDGLPEATECHRIDAPNGVKCLAVATDGRLWAGIESPAA